MPSTTMRIFFQGRWVLGCPCTMASLSSFSRLCMSNIQRTDYHSPSYSRAPFNWCIFNDHKYRKHWIFFCSQPECKWDSVANANWQWVKQPAESQAAAWSKSLFLSHGGERSILGLCILWYRSPRACPYVTTLSDFPLLKCALLEATHYYVWRPELWSQTGEHPAPATRDSAHRSEWDNPKARKREDCF